MTWRNVLASLECQHCVRGLRRERDKKTILLHFERPGSPPFATCRAGDNWQRFIESLGASGPATRVTAAGNARIDPLA